MLNVFKDQEKLNLEAAEIFVKSSRENIDKKGCFNVVLTGGTSPKGMYQLLSREAHTNRIQWDKVFVFWGDERWVDLKDEKSNAGMAKKTFLNQLPIPDEHIFPMWAEGRKPELFAAEYENRIRSHLGCSGVFDLIFLGMGEDGHTASLFPGKEVLKEESRWVVAYYLEAQKMHRITLTAPLINRAKKIVFLVFGKNKAHALSEVLKSNKNPDLYPAQLIQPSQGELIWLVDEAASGK